MPLIITAGEHPASGPCRADSARVRIDHVTIAVTDLTRAISTFERDLGFTMKPGTVHRNGLRNAHVKFADESAVELITVEEGTSDALSELYRRFLAAGEGGAFVALAAGPVDSVLVRLGEPADGATITRGPAVDWLAFPEGHPLHPVFFVDIRSHTPDPPALREHANGAKGLARVWLQVQAPESLEHLLAPLGGRWCGTWSDPAGISISEIGLANGSLVLAPLEPESKRGRIVGLTLEGEEPHDEVRAGGVRFEWEGGR